MSIRPEVFLFPLLKGMEHLPDVNVPGVLAQDDTLHTLRYVDSVFGMIRQHASDSGLTINQVLSTPILHAQGAVTLYDLAKSKGYSFCDKGSLRLACGSALPRAKTHMERFDSLHKRDQPSGPTH